MEGVAMLERIIGRILKWRADGKKKSLSNATRRIFSEAKQRIQIREYNGNICLSLDDIPVLVINDNPTAVLDASRELLASFLINNQIRTNMNEVVNVANPQVVKIESADVIEALNRSEVDIQIATAHRFPRDIKRAKDNIAAIAMMSKEVAYSCFYHLERKGADGTVNNIEGISIRLAEIIASQWGNLRVQSRIISNDGKFVTAQGVCHDLERNLAVSVEVKRSITNKYGGTFSTDMQMVTSNAACSIAFRNAVGKVVPAVIIEDIVQDIRKKSLEAIKSDGIAESWQKVLDTFVALGASESQILFYISKSSANEVSAEDIQILRGLYTAIKEGSTNINDSLIQPQKESKREKESKKEKNEAQKAVEESMNRSTKR